MKVDGVVDMTENKRNIWLDGIMGVVVGDALGLPVQFLYRSELKKNPLSDMIGFGTFHLPAGSWSDDSSLTLATLKSLKVCGRVDCDDIMERFADWLVDGEYTPFGESYDQGATCVRAIVNYINHRDASNCGVTGEYANGNGALMRIMPVCLWAYEKVCVGEWTDSEAVEAVHKVSALTHNHLRSQMACGFYYFMIKSILNKEGTLIERLQDGIDKAVIFYHQSPENLLQLAYYNRLLHLGLFKDIPEDKIASSGYVLDSIEAAIWCLINTDSVEACLLKAANLGEDTDTVAAIAGGLAGLYYGYHEIPEKWLEKIQKRDWIEELCNMS